MLEDQKRVKVQQSKLFQLILLINRRKNTQFFKNMKSQIKKLSKRTSKRENRSNINSNPSTIGNSFSDSQNYRQQVSKPRYSKVAKSKDKIHAIPSNYYSGQQLISTADRIDNYLSSVKNTNKNHSAKLETMIKKQSKKFLNLISQNDENPRNEDNYRSSYIPEEITQNKSASTSHLNNLYDISDKQKRQNVIHKSCKSYNLRISF